MATDREDALRKAEKLLRQGRIDAAIAEYQRVVHEQPGDWVTANTLGDLYVRAGQAAKAAALYGRIAGDFMREGFYPKAAAIFKKLLKLNPDDESTQLNLAEISQRQGLLADAKAYLNMVAARRRARGDAAGVAEIVVRLGSVDPNDIPARLTAAETLLQVGDERAAAARFRGIYEDLLEKGRSEGALDALRRAVAIDPSDQDGRVTLARAAVEAGDIDGARAFLDRETAGDDPDLLLALLEIELGSGDLDSVRDLLSTLLGGEAALRDRVLELAWSAAASNPEGAFALVDAAADSAIATSDFHEAAVLLQEFVSRVPNHIAALLKLVEVCVDGGLETAMYDAQAMLTDAYLAAKRGAEARSMAEDLVAREPWEDAHIDRFRRALVMLRVPEPDMVIAARLSGESPFMATDPFAPAVAAPEPAAEGDIEEPMAAEEPQDDVGGWARMEAEESVPLEEPFAAAPSLDPLAPAGEIDLTDALGGLDAVGAERAGAGDLTAASGEELESVFEGYRREAHGEAGDEDAAEHLGLARTYIEMGMEDEAIAPLETAVRSPRLRFEAASLLGRLCRQQGDAARAIEWLERAAEVPAPGVEEGRALLYELGALLEEAGETARALAIFLELQSEAGEYRDVAERVERLTRVEAGG